MALRPDAPSAHNNLGVALHDKGDLAGAIVAYKTALDLNPKSAEGYDNLGMALADARDFNGAVEAYRKAIAQDPGLADPHANLAAALYATGYLEGAAAACRRAIDLDPGHAHANLGAALHARGDVDGAVAECRRAIDLDPKLASAHGALGAALLQQGRSAEARAATQRGLDLLDSRDPLRLLASRQLQKCERLLALDGKLSAVLDGQADLADPAERLLLALLCGQYKHQHAAAARLYAGAFAADSRLAGDLRQQPRYNAACDSALAAAGQGEDARHLPDRERLALRRQALGWLRDDLALYRKQAGSDEPAEKQQVRERMRRWQQDTDLASVRDEAALRQLPDEERETWRQLWAGVSALLGTVDGKE